jgi:hypothetical protein
VEKLLESLHRRDAASNSRSGLALISLSDGILRPAMSRCVSRILTTSGDADLRRNLSGMENNDLFWMIRYSTLDNTFVKLLKTFFALSDKGGTL